METQPMPLQSMRNAPGGLDEFRLQTQVEIQGVLRELINSSVLVTISTPDGTAYTTTVWTMDSARGTVSFDADAHDPRISSLIDADEAVAVAYLDSVKVQFDVNALVLVRGDKHAALNCEWPREVYRIQRRSTFRVKPIANGSAAAHFCLPGAPCQTHLRILDVSLGGVALQLPDGAPKVEPGQQLGRVELDLDADTRIHADLIVHHVTVMDRDGRGSRLGCEFVRLPADEGRTLQRFIDQTQKRRRLLSLNL